MTKADADRIRIAIARDQIGSLCPPFSQRMRFWLDQLRIVQVVS